MTRPSVSSSFKDAIVSDKESGPLITSYKGESHPSKSLLGGGVSLADCLKALLSEFLFNFYRRVSITEWSHQYSIKVLGCRLEDIRREPFLAQQIREQNGTLFGFHRSYLKNESGIGGSSGFARRGHGTIGIAGRHI